MIYLIGMGPGDTRYLTLDAIEKIRNSKKVVAFGRICKTAENINPNIIKVKNVREVMEHIVENDDVSILASGDPCFYGLLEYLKSKNVEVDEVVPGLSSFQYMMAKLKKSWHNAELVSLHGRDEGLERIAGSKLSAVITDSKNTPHIISKALHSLGVTGRIYAGFNLSYEDEEIIIKSIGEDIPDISFLSVVVIENEMD